MRVFDDMVDEIRDGESYLARYDSGLEIEFNYESFTFKDDENSITISDGNILELLRAFLEVYITAREEPLNVNYDDLLNGF
jgi:hypothetical protein